MEQLRQRRTDDEDNALVVSTAPPCQLERVINLDLPPFWSDIFRAANTPTLMLQPSLRRYFISGLGSFVYDIIWP